MEFDETDTKILKNLLVDARLSARQLAYKLGLSTVTVLTRIKKLEQKKIITGYAARLDHQILGYDLTAIIEIKTTKGKMLEIESKRRLLSTFFNLLFSGFFGRLSQKKLRKKIQHNPLISWRF